MILISKEYLRHVEAIFILQQVTYYVLVFKYKFNKASGVAYLQSR